jgi:hypothetical protein
MMNLASALINTSSIIRKAAVKTKVYWIQGLLQINYVIDSKTVLDVPACSPQLSMTMRKEVFSMLGFKWR